MATWPDPRSIVVSMAFGNTLQENPISLEVISPGDDEGDPGPVRGPVTWERGRIGDAAETAPTKIAFVLDDPDGEYSRRNVTSTRYGTLREGTPVRLSLDIGAGPVTVATAGVLRFEPLWDGERDDGDTINPRVPISALGMLAGIGRDQEIRSALNLLMPVRITDPSITEPDVPQTAGRAYWPLESSLSSGLPGGTPLVGTFAGETGPAGSAGACSGSLSGLLTSWPGVTGWSLVLGVRIDSAVVGTQEILRIVAAGTTYLTVYVQATVGQELRLDFSYAGGSDSLTGSASTLDDGEWHWLALTLLPPIAIADVDDAAVISTTITTPWAEPNGLVVNSSEVLSAFCHIGYTRTDEGLTSSDVYEAFLGNVGEQAAARAYRALSLAGWLSDATRFAEVSPTVGAIQPGTVSSIVREAEDVEGGALIELRNRAMAMSQLVDRYNQDPAATFAWADIPGATPLDDDRDTYNVITATDNDGNFAIEQETDGPAGTNTIGARRLPITRNVYDPDDLRHQAGWVLRKGTIDRPRYIVYLDLYANPDLAADYLALDIGSRILITGAPPQHVGPNDLDLIVEGERGGLHGGEEGWVELHCQPYQPYEVRVWAEDSPPDLGDHMGRWATERHAAIRAAIDSDDTSVLIDPPINRWTTTAADLNESNYDALYARIGGETMKVTAISTTACTVVAAGTADHDDNAAVTPADYAGGAATHLPFSSPHPPPPATLAITDANYDYTLLRQQGGLYLWATVRGASAPAPTITPTGGSAGDTISAVQFGFASMPITLDDLTDAIIVAASVSSPTDQNITYPKVRQGSLSGRLILVVAGKNDDWTGVAPPSGFTELVDVSSTTGSDQGLYVAYRIDTTATAVAGSQLAVTGGASATSNAMTLALGSGYQTLTVTRSSNGVVKSHAAGAAIETVDPLIWAL